MAHPVQPRRDARRVKPFDRFVAYPLLQTFGKLPRRAITVHWLLSHRQVDHLAQQLRYG